MKFNDKTRFRVFEDPGFNAIKKKKIENLNILAYIVSLVGYFSNSFIQAWLYIMKNYNGYFFGNMYRAPFPLNWLSTPFN